MEAQRKFYNPTPADVEALQAISDWTAREAANGTMAYRSMEGMSVFAKSGDCLLLVVDGVKAATATKTHTYTKRVGPLGLFTRHIHEIGAVTTEEGYQGNGYARDVVTEAVRQQMNFGKRLRRGELLKPRIIAMVQVDNALSNKFFTRLGSQLSPEEVPSEAFAAEGVGTGEYSHAYNTYDITQLGRRRA